MMHTLSTTNTRTLFATGMRSALSSLAQVGIALSSAIVFITFVVSCALVLGGVLSATEAAICLAYSLTLLGIDFWHSAQERKFN